MSNYSNYMEAADLINWQQAIKHLPKGDILKNIKDYTPTVYQYDHKDVLTWDGTNVYQTELKHRTWSKLQYAIKQNSLYIEPDKIDKCIDYYVTLSHNPKAGENIFDSWKHLWVHILPTLPDNVFHDEGMVPCGNSGKLEHKYSIPVTLALHYEYNPVTDLMERQDKNELLDWTPCQVQYDFMDWYEKRQERFEILNLALYKAPMDCDDEEIIKTDKMLQ